MSTVKAIVTPQHVKEAYAALNSGDPEKIKQYWAEEMSWQVPGHNRLSCWYFGRDEFLAFMGQVGQLSGNSFRMENIAGQVIVTGEYSANITRNQGNRADQADKTMDIEVVHVLRWKDGKVIAGKGAIFGDGATGYDLFWSSSPMVTPPTHSGPTPMAVNLSVEANKAVLDRHFNQVLNQGLLDVVDEIYTNDYVLDAPVRSDGSSQSRGLTQGREQLKQRVTLFRTAFPDIHFSQDDVVGEGDTVVVRCNFSGTQRGEFAGIQPGGRTISIMGILIAHLENEKIREAWSAFDSAELMKQLGN